MPNFKAHCSSVVKEYVHSVLMIDDEAGMGESQADKKPVVAQAPTSSPAKGLGSKIFGKAAVLHRRDSKDVVHSGEGTGERRDAYEGVIAKNHLFDAQLATSSFYEHGIVAGLYKPVIEDGLSSQDFAATVKEPALKSDVIIVDWMLKKDSPGYSQELIRSIIRNDIEKGGRLRVIIVYTGEQYLNQKRNDLFELLNEDEFIDVTKSSDYEIHSKNLVIAFYNKPRVENQDGRAIESDQLPRVSLEEFSKLVNGIVPAFAMKAASEIRNSTGRIISKYSQDLDVAYLLHRALLPKSEDAEVFMLENIISYLRNILAIKKVDKNSLGADQIQAWVDHNYEKYHKKIHVKKQEISLTKEQLSALLTNGFTDLVYDILISSKVTENNARSFVSSKSNILSLISILDSHDELADASAKKLSVLTSFRRIFGDVIEDVEFPYLTQGSVVYSRSNKSLLLCVTPKCDTARVDSSRKFSFTRLNRVAQSKEFDLVIPVLPFVEQEMNKPLLEQISGIKSKFQHDIEIEPADSERAKDEKHKKAVKEVMSIRSIFEDGLVFVKTEKSFHELVHINFEADHSTKRVTPVRNGDTGLEYNTPDSDDKYVWIGDLQDLDIQKRVSNLVGNFNRVGTDEVEWLRRQYQTGSVN